MNQTNGSGQVTSQQQEASSSEQPELLDTTISAGKANGTPSFNKLLSLPAEIQVMIWREAILNSMNTADSRRTHYRLCSPSERDCARRLRNRGHWLFSQMCCLRLHVIPHLRLVITPSADDATKLLNALSRFKRRHFEYRVNELILGNAGRRDRFHHPLLDLMLVSKQVKEIVELQTFKIYGTCRILNGVACCEQKGRGEMVRCPIMAFSWWTPEVAATPTLF